MAESHAEMVERYQRVMDGAADTGTLDISAGDPDSIAARRESLQRWLAKFQPPTHAKPLPARALGKT